MDAGPPSSATKRTILRALLVEGLQTTKLVVEPALLGATEAHGFPADVVSRYPSGIPLDLNPRWPLELDLEDDPDRLQVSLSFKGFVTRVRIPWRAVVVVGVGFGGVQWEHEVTDEPAPHAHGEPGAADADGPARAAHLRLVK